MVPIPRHIEFRIREALADTRIVLVEGARQVGKTTLVEQFVTENDGVLVSLDDSKTLDFARSSPVEFVSQAAGRIEGIELHGFSQGEMAGHRERFIDRVLAGDRFDGHRSSLSRQDYAERAVAGGYPEALARSSTRRRNEWLDRYVTQIVRRDAEDISRFQRGDELPLLLRMLAARNACELNIADMAKESGIPTSTLRRMIGLLESLFLIQSIPAWSTNLTKRAVRRPKVSLLDSGLTASLMKVTAEGVSAMRPHQSSLAGPLLEGFVAGELRRQLEWADEYAFVSHFRDRASGEVDLILSTGDGRVAGIEVKATSRPTVSDFTTLRRLRDKLGGRFTAGIVLHTGESTLPFSEKLAAVPIDILWTA